MMPNAPRRRDFTHSNYGKLPFAESAIMLPFGRNSFLPALVQRFHAAPIPMGPNTDREAYAIDRGNQAMTLIFSGMGSPVTANALEKAAANGVRRLVLLGPCGGVAPNVRVGDLVIPSGAIRGEGTSRYYLPPAFPAAPDAELCSSLRACATRAPGTSVHRGFVYTTDASYRQGPEVYEDFGETVTAVDCECAAAFVVAAALKLRLAAILFCTDNVRLPDLAHQKRQGLENPDIRRAFDTVADCAVEALADPTGP